jgi:hypothetical protein
MKAKRQNRTLSVSATMLDVSSSRYTLDISTRCIELKASRAEVIPINRQQKGMRKPTPQ